MGFDFGLYYRDLEHSSDARIVIEDGAPVLEDLASKNGTFLRGERLAAPTSLADGDVFRFGRVNVTLKACATATRPAPTWTSESRA